MSRESLPNWRRVRSLKAAATRKAREGPDIFKRLGAKGGRHSKNKIDLPEIVPYEPLQDEPLNRR